MQRTARYIIITGISLGFLSMLFFLSLVAHIPFFIPAPLVIGGIILLIRTFSKATDDFNTDKTAYPIVAFLALAAGIALLIQKSYAPAYKFGGWDAWSIWNLHARYMAGGVGAWRNIFLNTFGDHPDYPLLVPGINGFFMRLCPGKLFVVIPFIFSFTITLFIPVLIYVENLKKNIVVAILVLFLMAQDVFYLFNGVSQYADMVLAFFFLCAQVCIDHAGEKQGNITLAAACIGCCMWTKNEGVVLAGIFVLFNMRSFFSVKNIKYVASGIGLPLLVLLIFKIGYAPKNDMVGGQGMDTLHHILEPDRYKLIYSHFSDQIDKNFSYFKIGFCLYVLLCIVEKKWPGKQFAMLIACMFAYTMIYVLSPQVLEWQLSTSLERLMMQLSPIAIYVFSQRFCRVRFSLAD